MNFNGWTNILPQYARLTQAAVIYGTFSWLQLQSITHLLW